MVLWKQSQYDQLDITFEVETTPTGVAVKLIQSLGSKQVTKNYLSSLGEPPVRDRACIESARIH